MNEVKKLRYIRLNHELKLSGKMADAILSLVATIVASTHDFDEAYNWLKSDLPNIRSGNHLKTAHQYQVIRDIDAKIIYVEKWIPTKSIWITVYAISSVPSINQIKQLNHDSN